MALKNMLIISQKYLSLSMMLVIRLKLLMLNPGQVVTRSAILERIAEDTPDCTESSLKIHISHLRRKLREAGAGDCIEAVWGIGFRLREG